MTDTVIPQVIILDEQDVEAKEWYLRGCFAFNKRTGGAQKTRLGNLRAVLTNADRMWDNGSTITYCFVKPYVNIKFKFVTSRNATIRIAFDEDEGSWSYIARDLESIPCNQPTMNYGWVSTNPQINEEDRGVILDDFGHSLGPPRAPVQSPWREDHSRRRGCDWWTPADVRQQILDVYDDTEASSFSSINLTSIMIYFMPKEMNVERIEVPPINKLSESDKAYGIINYPFIKTPSSNPLWNIEHARDVAGVQGEARERILSEGDSKGRAALEAAGKSQVVTGSTAESTESTKN
ncbi:unnamed protein product [Cyclocybe aegerita]|uniref:Uncharacterized protein n=1 Tax=Cyclocybe aegerita TaxID=1973307 RepID=A0A8S0VV84_CYCAE|nr:unnamed protein product [Cyclocybe aegerita]